MIKVLIDSNKKVIGYYGTDIELKTVDEVPEKPQGKMGVDHILYYDEIKNKAVYKEVERQLTEQEKIEKRLKETESNLLATMEALAEIHEGGGA